MRLTPTYRELTPIVSTGGYPLQAHPHIQGAYLNHGILSLGIEGSPPHTGSLHTRVTPLKGVDGLTPTYRELTLPD